MVDILICLDSVEVIGKQQKDVALRLLLLVSFPLYYILPILLQILTKRFFFFISRTWILHAW